jgi:L-fuconolactonase
VRIDAHQHFWRYTERDHGWIDARMARIRRDFLPQDLAPELEALGFDGCIAVQARSSPAENEFLLGLAREHPFVRGVVGWVDLCADDVARELERFAADPLAKGVRHVVQDEPDDEFLLRPDFQRGIAKLAGHGLTYDVLVYPRHLEAVERFARAFPGQPMVLDHLGKPAVGPDGAKRWKAAARKLCRLPNLHCKLSGLVTEAAWNGWTHGELWPYLDAALSAFGATRVMFGSDWPVCLLAAENYAAVAQVVLTWTDLLERTGWRMSPTERDAILGGNAARFYGVT